MRTVVFAIICALSTHVFATTITVFAPASLKTVVDELTMMFETQSPDQKIRVSFAGSSVLARQIIAGAPADLYVSANTKWMDHVEAKGRVLPQSRQTLVNNRLALISKKPGPQIRLDRQTPFHQIVDSGRLAVALVDAVPAGMYAKSALETLGHWDTVEPRIAQADNVRAALQLVALGEAPYGIVYVTDAKAEPSVYQRGIFPAETHPVIEYVSALIARPRDSNQDALASAFHTFLHSDTAKRVFSEHGFLVDLP